MLVEHRVMPSTTREFAIAPTTDTHVILRLSGMHRVETRHHDGWRGGVAEAGSLHVIDDGETEHVRFTASSWCELGHFFIPRPVIDEASEVVGRAGVPGASRRLRGLRVRDPLMASTCRALLAATAHHYPDLYAEQAALWLAVHALVRRGGNEQQARSLPRSTDVRLARAIDLIRDGYARPLTLDRLAQEAGVSKFHFVRLFRRHTGSTPVAYLERVRLAAARRHLSEGGHSISEIAALTGFSGPDQLGSAFKRVHGVPPSVYRANRRGPRPISTSRERTRGPSR